MPGPGVPSPLPQALAHSSWGAALGARGCQPHTPSGPRRRPSALASSPPHAPHPGDPTQPQPPPQFQASWGSEQGPRASRNLSFPIRNPESDKDQAHRGQGPGSPGPVVLATPSSSQGQVFQSIFPVQRKCEAVRSWESGELLWKSEGNLERKTLDSNPCSITYQLCGIRKLPNFSEPHLFGGFSEMKDPTA